MDLVDSKIVFPSPYKAPFCLNLIILVFVVFKFCRFFWEEVNTTFSLLNHDIKFVWLNSNYVVHQQLQQKNQKQTLY